MQRSGGRPSTANAGKGTRPGPTAAKPGQAPGLPKPPQRPSGSVQSRPTGTPPAPAAPSAASNRKATSESVVKVYSLKPDQDDSGIATLLGDYVEKGSNHGRKTYQKQERIPGHEGVEVYLYYWDNRDGKDFCGWWFGDKVGGSQVWSRADAHGQLPPREGWRIPWDGPPIKDLLLVEPPGSAPSGKPAPTAAKLPSRQPSAAKPQADSQQPVKASSANAFSRQTEAAAERVAAIEARTQEALTTVSEGLNGQVTEDVLQELEETLKEQQQAVNAEQKALAQEINDAKTNGHNVNALARLSPRLRALQTSLVTEAGKIKATLSKAKQKLQDDERRVAERRRAEMTDKRDAEMFQESVPASTDIVLQAEDSVETVAIMASSLSSEEDEELGEEARRTMNEIEEAAIKAQSALGEAKKHISAQLSMAKRYSDKTRQVAMSELTAMQSRLTEAHTKLAPFRRFKQDWEQKIAAKKAIEEVVRILGSAELEVEKAHIMSSAGLENQMSEDEIKSAEDLLTPAQNGIAKAQQSIADKKAKTRDDGVLANELEKLHARAQQSKAKLEEVKSVLQRQREGLKAADILQQIEGRINTVDDAIAKTSEAEMPFLKGLDVLPKEEGTQAIKESEDAIAGAETAIGQARTQLKTRQTDAKRFSKVISQRLTNELNELAARLEGYMNQLRSFKKTTTQRKLKAMLQEVVDAVQDAEGQVHTLSEVCKLLTSENLESVSTDSLKATCESSASAEKDASAAINQAKKIMLAKQQDGKDGLASMPEFKKLEDRIKTAMSELLQHKKAVASGDRLIKSKSLLAEEESKLKSIESELSKVEDLATPLGDEKPSEEALKKIDAAVSAVQTSNQSSTRSLNQMNEGALVPVKAALSKLIARNKAVQDRINKVKAYSAEQRELVSSELWVAEAVSKVELVEKAIQQVGVAELPYLKGIEVLPAAESQPAIAASEIASEAAHKAINDARTYIATQLIEAKKFKGDKARDMATKELNKITERINTSAATASKFKRDTENRKRNASMHEATEMLSSLEAEVEKTTQAAAPLEEGNESLTPDAAREVCDNLAKLEKAAQQRIDEAKATLDKRVREMKGHTKEEEQIANLLKRLQTVQLQLAKAKKAASEHEQRFVAKLLLVQAENTLKDTEADVEKVKSHAAPLLTDGGAQYLVAGQVLFLVEALKEHMKKTEKTVEKLFQDICGNESSASKVVFVTYLEKLPEDISRDDLTYSAEQREAIFTHADADKDGAIGLKDFKDLFCERFICVKSISITDGFEISSSKTVAKLEIDETVELLGEPKPFKGGSLHRVECKVVESGQVGWVTMKGNQGTSYLEAFSPYDAFVKAMDRNIEVTWKQCNKSASFIKSKAAELAHCTQGPLLDARNALGKLKPRVTEAQNQVQELKKKVTDAKKEYLKREEAEKRTQQETIDKKAAAVLLKPVLEKVELMDASLQKFTEAVKALVSANGATLEAVADPLSISENAEKDAAQLNKDVAAVKASVSEQQAAVAKATQGPMYEAKQELTKITTKAESAEKKCKSTIEAVHKARTKIATAQLEKLSEEMRGEVLKRGITVEALFAEIAGKDQDKISEEAFCKYVTSLERASMPMEHAKLVCHQIEGAGIGRATFNRVLQRYFLCVKQIAITNEFTISKSKTVRMVELNEIVEVLEGPKGDEKTKVTRVRAKALTDGAIGWISVKGNQGTPFLKDTSQPCYYCAGEVALEKEFRNESETEGVLRMLKTDEAFEVIEGPRKVKYDMASRAKGKACKDGKDGWFTVKTKEGTINAEKSGKFFTCTAGIAMTDARDIKQCKVLRKLEVGETCMVLEGPVEEGNANVTRIHGKSMKDGQEGWVTIKGNAGTVYAEENTKLYTMLHDTPLQKSFSSDQGGAIRTLSKGEVFEVTEGPKDEAFDEVFRLRGRATHDGAIGWVTLKSQALKSWTPFYKCVANTVIHNALAGKSAQVVRRIEPGEVVEVLDGPMEDTEMGIMRIKGRAEKDGAVGWMTIKGNQGTVFLKPR